MNSLVSLDVAKLDWRVDHDSDDENIERILTASSESVLTYLKLEFDHYDDSSGGISEDDVPFAIRAAVLMLGGIMYRDPTGKESEKWEHGYLPRPVMNLLYPLRDPSLA